MKVVLAILAIGLIQWLFAAYWRLSGRGEPDIASIFKDVPQDTEKETKKDLNKEK